MDYVTAILGWIITIFAGVAAADVAIQVLYGYQVVDFLWITTRETSLILYEGEVQIGWVVGAYLATDLIAFIGSKIAGGSFRFPRYANPIVTLLMGVVMLLILPIYGAIKSAIELIKVLFMFLWWLLTKKKGDKLKWGSGNSGRRSGGCGKDNSANGRGILKRKVREICASYERGYSKSVGAGTSMNATVRGNVFMNSVEVKVKLLFSIRTDVVNTAYDMQKEQNMIRDIVQRFPSGSIEGEILSVIGSLVVDHSDMNGQFGVRVDVDYDVQTV